MKKFSNHLLVKKIHLTKKNISKLFSLHALNIEKRVFRLEKIPSLYLECEGFSREPVHNRSISSSQVGSSFFFCRSLTYSKLSPAMLSQLYNLQISFNKFTYLSRNQWKFHENSLLFIWRCNIEWLTTCLWRWCRDVSSRSQALWSELASYWTILKINKMSKIKSFQQHKKMALYHE